MIAASISKASPIYIDGPLGGSLDPSKEKDDGNHFC